MFEGLGVGGREMGGLLGGVGGYWGGLEAVGGIWGSIGVPRGHFGGGVGVDLMPQGAFGGVLWGQIGSPGGILGWGGGLGFLGGFWREIGTHMEAWGVVWSHRGMGVLFWGLFGGVLGADRGP